MEQIVSQAGVPPELEAQDFPPIALERTRDTGLSHLPLGGRNRTGGHSLPAQ